MTSEQDRRVGSLLGVEVAGQEITGLSLTEQLACECNDRDCGCAAACTAFATYTWGRVESREWQHLCRRCANRLVARGTVPDISRQDAPVSESEVRP